MIEKNKNVLVFLFDCETGLSELKVERKALCCFFLLHHNNDMVSTIKKSNQIPNKYNKT